ncbi:hypothetical protein UK23_08220 [Lentzea aerocolonigenes]|uniref:Thioester domain-containing protein n=1 Tax=Lentzea aerocolonigenes TaxID=68170 RepID=A0A0F0HC26_LENAE|nr:thioester domain-containing protein [Lentzea aerocolonigenes]KJK51193.1 hypothetical protein UK23_08220 [Lentzea aerocolonigenes]
MASRLRIGAALFGATALLSMSTLAASADVIVKPIQDENQKKYGYEVTFVDGVGNLPEHTPPKGEYGTVLIPLEVQENGKTSKAYAYCVELPTNLDKNKGLKEAKWGDHPNPDSKFRDNAGKVLWILLNSFPTKSTNELDKLYDGDYNELEAITATQAAIWHFSDGVELKGVTQHADDVTKLYKKLIEQAQDIKEQPKPTLEIDPASKSGKAGEKIGPFKVTTTANELKLTAELPDGVTITDAEGKPLNVEKKAGKSELTAKAEGNKVSEFFVNVPADAAKGEAKMNVSAEATLQAGRLFIAEDKNHKTQSLVIAQDSKVKVAKDAKADWIVGEKPTTPTTTTTTETTTTTPTTTTTTTTNNPAPGGSTDDLASTGASILWPLVGGLALVGAGIGALFVVRRKKAGAAE